MLKNKGFRFASIQASDPGWRREVGYWWGRDMKDSLALPFIHDDYSYSHRVRGKNGFWLYETKGLQQDR